MSEKPLTKNYILIHSGKTETVFEAPPSGHGEYRVIWKDGIILDVVKEERIRIKSVKN